MRLCGRSCRSAIRWGVLLSGVLLCWGRYCVGGTMVSGELLCRGRYCVVGACVGKLLCQEAIVSRGYCVWALFVLGCYCFGALLCLVCYGVVARVWWRLCGGTCVGSIVSGSLLCQERYMLHLQQHIHTLQGADNMRWLHSGRLISAARCCNPLNILYQ